MALAGNLQVDDANWNVMPGLVSYTGGYTEANDVPGAIVPTPESWLLGGFFLSGGTVRHERMAMMNHRTWALYLRYGVYPDWRARVKDEASYVGMDG